MTDYANADKAAVDKPEEPKDVPFELIPQLAADEDFISKADRLYELKQTSDQLFDDTRDKETGLPRGEFGQLKLELGARVMAAGIKSLAYMDLRIANTEGGETRGKTTGRALISSIGISTADDPNAEDYQRLYAIALAAKELDESILLSAGIPAHAIAAAREPGKPRAASVRVEWISSKGRGGKTRAAGGGTNSAGIQ